MLKVRAVGPSWVTTGHGLKLDMSSSCWKYHSRIQEGQVTTKQCFVTIEQQLWQLYKRAYRTMKEKMDWFTSPGCCQLLGLNSFLQPTCCLSRRTSNYMSCSHSALPIPYSGRPLAQHNTKYYQRVWRKVRLWSTSTRVSHSIHYPG